MNDRLVLAGPILRRCESDRIHIWIATGREALARALIFDLSSGEPRHIGGGTGDVVRLGPNLYVHLIAATPDTPPFPTERLLGYDIALRCGDEEVRLNEAGLPGSLAAITYDDLPLPSFFISPAGRELRVLHGSCRLLHGRGPDALALADRVVADHAQDLERRPSTLFLTGDQIYGDDVADALIGHLTGVGAQLIGEHDETSLPEIERLTDVPVGERKDLIKERACFTSHAGENHLMSFGEFVAMYLVVWNEGNWPDDLPEFDAVFSDKSGLRDLATRRKFKADVGALNEAKATLWRVRRLLANTSTYMIFDDHDVTDDWNLTRKWHYDVKRSPLGRRIVANALLAFWAFQGWGNDPTASTRLADDIRTALDDPNRMDELMWSHEKWSFSTPTTPPIVVLNTRTRRTYDSDEGAARLIGADELDRIKDLISRSGYEPGDPLVLVSATPVFALEMAERRQKFLRGKVGPYEVDLEAWHDNLCGLVDLMHLFVDEVGAESVVILSGDVHYGMSLDVGFSIGGRSVRIVQLVSSSLKHGGRISKRVLNVLGRGLLRDHIRVGWEHPPREMKSSGLRGRIAQRAANTDEWNEDSPVFLSPTIARQLRISVESDLREERAYVKTSGARRVRLVGEHNVGLVVIAHDRVRQELLCDAPSGIDTYATELRLTRDPTPASGAKR